MEYGNISGNVPKAYVGGPVFCGSMRTGYKRQVPTSMHLYYYFRALVFGLLVFPCPTKLDEMII